MKYYIPQLKISLDLPPQSKPEDKVGGLPWGLTLERYPVCRNCGKSQSLLLQLVHHPDRLNLGRPGRNLFVFQCNNYEDGRGEVCSTWDGSSGANACFVLEPEDLADSLSPMPADSPWLEVEAHIVGWQTADDGISPDKVTPEGAFCNLSEEEIEDPYILENQVYGGTKLGSAPYWIQDPRGPGKGWTFVGQLYGEYRLSEEPSTEAKTSPRGQTGHIYQRRDGGWGISGPNFGDAGNGYIFVQIQPKKAEGYFLWQCF